MLRGAPRPGLGLYSTLNNLARQHRRYRDCVGHWPMVEGGGTRVCDVSGYGNHGTVTNATPATVWAQGPTGWFLDLDGTNDYVECGGGTTTSVLNLLGNYTLAAWIRPDTYGDGSFGRILDRQVSASGNGYCLAMNNNPGGSPPGTETLTANVGTGANAVSANDNIITLGVWQHVAVVFDDLANTITFYVNGVESGIRTHNSSLVSNTATLKIGDRTDLTRSFNGGIAEARIYNRALSAVEIASLYMAPHLEIEWALGLLDHVGAVEAAAGSTIPVKQWQYRQRRSA